MSKTKRSSILKMLDEVSDKRKISAFPTAYSPYLTPYLKFDFCETTKNICDNNRAVLSSLKICKVIILGDVSVGKTCIVNRFCHEIYDSKYKTTIGVDFEVEKFEILGVPFNLQIWDTAGQERFKSIAQSYYRSSHVVIVVFDVTDISTLSHCKLWMKEALDASSFAPYKFLIGTKKDLLSKASYDIVENYARKVAKLLDAEYCCVSSKTGENIERLFNRIAALVFDDYILKESEKSPKAINISSEMVSIKKNKQIVEKRRSTCSKQHCN